MRVGVSFVGVNHPRFQSPSILQLENLLEHIWRACEPIQLHTLVHTSTHTSTRTRSSKHDATVCNTVNHRQPLQDPYIIAFGFVVFQSVHTHICALRWYWCWCVCVCICSYEIDISNEPYFLSLWLLFASIGLDLHATNIYYAANFFFFGYEIRAPYTLHFLLITFFAWLFYQMAFEMWSAFSLINSIHYSHIRRVVVCLNWLQRHEVDMRFISYCLASWNFMAVLSLSHV